MAIPALAGGARENQNVRLKPVQLQADLDALTALKGFAVYTPANTAYAAAKQTAMKAAQDAEIAAQNALATARDAATATEWDFHNAMLGVKEQVIAQFGKSSDQVQALGLKKKVEYKTPVRRGKSKTT